MLLKSLILGQNGCPVKIFFICLDSALSVHVCIICDHHNLFHFAKVIIFDTFDLHVT